MTSKIIRTACLAYLVGLFIVILFPKLLTPYSAIRQHADFLLQMPSARFLLGTDELGRDLLARILYGARVSLACALGATFIAGSLGLLYGSISGWAEGYADTILMRFLDVLYSIPDLLLYIILGLFLGRGFWGIVFALSAAAWITPARVVRGETLKHKHEAFVEAARSLGMRPSRILVRHVIPQILPTLAALLVIRIPLVMLAEAALSFIGLGLDPPHASLGTLASEGYGALSFYPHLIFFPCLFITITVYAITLLHLFFWNSHSIKGAPHEK